MNPQIQNNINAILVVSFGTAIRKTRAVTLDAIENSIKAAYPDYIHYRAWTSKILREKVFTTEGIQIDSIADSMIRMEQDGIRKVIVQPVFVSDGPEYAKMKQEVLAFRERFQAIRIGLPLLHKEADLSPIVDAIAEEYTKNSSLYYNQELPKNELVVLMGHGSAKYGLTEQGTTTSRSTEYDATRNDTQKRDPSDHTDCLYQTLDTEFKRYGHTNIFVKTMTSVSALDELISIANERGVSKIILAPFMIVAGRHAIKDMSGEQETSWKSRLEQAGLSVECVMKGLGEIPEIRQIFISGIREMLI